jgi:hypothetical protein
MQSTSVGTSNSNDDDNQERQTSRNTAKHIVLTITIHRNVLATRKEKTHERVEDKFDVVRVHESHLG